MSTLDSSTIQSLEHQLKQQRKVIQENIRKHLHQSEDPSLLTLANHLEEEDNWAEADLLVDTEIAQISQEIDELKRIELALQRILSGSYGVCDNCGEAISSERMMAQSTAPRCVKCQEALEKRQGHPNISSI